MVLLPSSEPHPLVFFKENTTTMFNFNFFARVLDFAPTFSRNQVCASADKTYDNVTKHTLPLMLSASDLFQGQKLKDKTSIDFLKQITQAVSGKNAFDSIAKCLQNAVGILEYCNEQSYKIFNTTEARQGMTFAKFTLLRTVQCCEFASEYSRKLLNYVLAQEALANGVNDLGVSKKETQWLDDNILDFVVALKALDQNKEGFKAHIEGIPDAIITEATERTFSTTIGQKKYDPMGVRQFSVEFSPFYFIGMLKANWQEKKFQAAQEDLLTIQMRILHLEKLKVGTGDAKIEKQIAYHQERVTKLTQEIEEMKKDYQLGE